MLASSLHVCGGVPESLPRLRPASDPFCGSEEPAGRAVGNIFRGTITFDHSVCRFTKFLNLKFNLKDLPKTRHTVLL